jgi:hypothetical protein
VDRDPRAVRLARAYALSVAFCGATGQLLRDPMHARPTERQLEDFAALLNLHIQRLQALSEPGNRANPDTATG